MECSLLNFKRFESGALVGFFDFAVNGIVITGCKAFKRTGDHGEDRVWFAWPAEKSQDKEGNDHWREIVTASEPVMRHLQSMVRGQLRNLLDNESNGSPPKPRTGRPVQNDFRTPEGEDLSDYKSNQKAKTKSPFSL